jgi:D-alanyl-D-alanine carboxypeptidase
VLALAGPLPFPVILREMKPDESLFLDRLVPSWPAEAALSAVPTAHRVPSCGYAFQVRRAGRFLPEKAEALGLRQTHFANPHGLDAPGHYSTARDLARLMLACMENESLRTLASTKSAVLGGTAFLNHNKLLRSCPGCIGGKTGYTRAAGRCLVSCCERDGMRLACVTLSDPDDWNDHRRLYDWAYDAYRLHDLSEELRFEVPVISGSRTAVTAAPAPGARLLLPRHGETPLHVELPRFVFAPVEEGDSAGELSLLKDGVTLVRFPIIYTQGAVLADPCMYAQ